jgi:ubiquinone/menaquinone biosynthesis C-methylase UbiE
MLKSNNQKQHDYLTRKLFHSIHKEQINTQSGFLRLKNLLNYKNLKLNKDYFKEKICADLGCGSTGGGALNLLELGCKFVHLMDLNKHIKKPINMNLINFKDKFKIHVASLEKTPFKNDSFDFILCQNAIHHMDKPKKAFYEIYRTLKKNGKALISVQGEGGLVTKFVYELLVPEYKRNIAVRKFLTKIINQDTKRYDIFFKEQLDFEALKVYKILKKFLDPDLILTIKDRLLSPKYYCFNERKLTIFLKKIGFKNIYRIKKKVYFSNIRKLLSPLYHHYDHEISRALYGDGDISLICSK